MEKFRHELTDTTKITIEYPEISGGLSYDDSIVLTINDTKVLVCLKISPFNGKFDKNKIKVNYFEHGFATGSIPLNYLRRELHKTSYEMYIQNLIASAVSSLIPSSIQNKIYISVCPLSIGDMTPEIAAIPAVSLLLKLNGLSNEIIAATRIIQIEKEFISNPDFKSIFYSNFNLLIAASKNNISLFELYSAGMSLTNIEAAAGYSFKFINEFLSFLNSIKIKKTNQSGFYELNLSNNLFAEIVSNYDERINDAVILNDLKQKVMIMDNLKNNLTESLSEEQEILNKDVFAEIALKEIRKNKIKNYIFENEKRPSGRNLGEVRQNDYLVKEVKPVHGLSLFYGHHNQIVSSATLGKFDRKIITKDSRGTNYFNQFTHSFIHSPFLTLPYINFNEEFLNSYVEQTAFYLFPHFADFPYAVRNVNEIFNLNSAGLSEVFNLSLLAFHSSGIPLKEKPVSNTMAVYSAGGLYKFAVDPDMEEIEASDGIITVTGKNEKIFSVRFCSGNLFLNKEMIVNLIQRNFHYFEVIENDLKKHFENAYEISDNIPAAKVIKVPGERIAWIIGRKGENIISIRESTKTDINIEEDELVLIYGKKDQIEKAAKKIKEIAQMEDAKAFNFLGLKKAAIVFADEIQPGDTLEGQVQKLLPFGIHIRTQEGIEGFVYLTELGDGNYTKPEEAVKLGDKIKVKVIEKDGLRFKFSAKEIK